MKQLILLTTIFFANLSTGQIIIQDAEGESSIVWGGGSVGLDIGDSKIKANYFNDPIKKSSILWGVDLQAENKSGLGALLNKNELTPGGKLSAVVGWQKGESYYKDGYQSKSDSINIEVDRHTNIRDENLEKIELTLPDQFESFYAESNISSNSELVNKIKSIQKSNAYHKYVKELLNVMESLDADKNKAERKSLKSFISDLQHNQDLKLYCQARIDLASAQKFRSELVKRYERFSGVHKFYCRPSLEVSEFTLDLGMDSTTFKSRFVDTLDISPKLEFGYTGRIGHFFLGGSFAFLGTSTFSSLDDSDYKYSIEDTTITNGELESSKTFTAYSGSYDTFTRFILSLDAVYAASLGESKKYLLCGLYYRTYFSMDSDHKDFTVLGTAFNFVSGKDGKFLGGLYFQTSDLFNQNDNPFKNSLSFGLTTKFAFSTFL